MKSAYTRVGPLISCKYDVNMGKGKFYRRLQHIGRSLRLPILVGVIFALGVAFIRFLWWVIEQLVGEVVVTVVKPYLTKLLDWLSNILPESMNWVVNHPVYSSIVFFFLVLSVVTIKTYLETRDPAGFVPLLPFDPKRPYGNLIGAIIHNNTGDDLVNCRCHINKVRVLKNKNWVEVEYRLPQELHWRSELTDFIRDRISIDSGNVGCIVVAAMDGQNKSARFKVKEISDDFFEFSKGKYQAEIIFGGNRRDNSTITMNFWIEIVYDDINLLSIGDLST